ncbi:MAG: hypothetical protein GX638_03440 [Crenarchaeota archaeon]|nr:hypothetical protein [Thermoproteota archaeon]
MNEQIWEYVFIALLTSWLWGPFVLGGFLVVIFCINLLIDAIVSPFRRK